MAFLALYQVMLGTCIYMLFAGIQEEIITTGAQEAQTTALENKAGQSNLYQSIWLLLYTILLLRLIVDWKYVARLLPKLFVPGVMVAISLWAYLLYGAHFESITKLGMYFITVLFSMWAAAVVPVEKFFEIFYRLAVASSIFSLLVYPIYSQNSLLYDLDARPNIFGLSAYGGTFGHKNLAALFFGFGLLIAFIKFINMIRLRRNTVTLKKSFFRSSLDVVSVACLFVSLGLTGGTASIFALIAGCGAALAINLMMLGTAARLGLITALACAAIVGPVFYQDILLLFGRDADLTGRTQIFAEWPHYFSMRPLFGYGYGEFFLEIPESPGFALTQLLRKRVECFESGYLQAGIDFGGIGLLLILYVMISSLANGWRFFKNNFGVSPYAQLPFAAICFIATSSISDIFIVVHNTVSAAVLFYIFFGPISEREVANRD
jgi:O-antigen ligase